MGADGFRLLRRNGAAQRAQSSSSRLVALQPSASGLRVQEVAELPHAETWPGAGGGGVGSGLFPGLEPCGGRRKVRTSFFWARPPRK